MSVFLLASSSLVKNLKSVVFSSNSFRIWMEPGRCWLILFDGAVDLKLIL